MWGDRKNLGGDTMKKVIALLLVVALVTAFALVPSASAANTVGKIADRVNFLNNDKFKWDVKAGKPVQFWAPLGATDLKWILGNNPDVQVQFYEGVSKAFQAWVLEEPVCSYDQWEPDENGLVDERAAMIATWEATNFWQGMQNEYPYGVDDAFESCVFGDDVYEFQDIWANAPEDYMNSDDQWEAAWTYWTEASAAYAIGESADEPYWQP
jgi:hypothetical protein